MRAIRYRFHLPKNRRSFDHTLVGDTVRARRFAHCHGSTEQYEHMLRSVALGDNHLSRFMG